MGYRISVDRTGEPPFPTTIKVTCDGNHGLFGPPSATFDVFEEHPRTPAVRAGWRITGDGVVLCPDC